MKLKTIYHAELLIAAIAVIAMFMGSINNNTGTNGNIRPYNGGWTINAYRSAVTLPYMLQEVAADQPIFLENMLPQKLDSGDALMFYTAHATVRVSVAGETIYSFGKSVQQVGKTPGCLWNVVSLEPEYSGKPVQITLAYSYSGEKHCILPCYLGTTYALLLHVIKDKFVPLLVSVCMAAFGIVLLIVWLLQRKQLGKNEEFLYLGTFGVLSSVWSAVETQLPQLVFGYNAVFAQLSWILLLLIPYPFIMMVVTMFRCEQSRIVQALKLLAVSILPAETVLYAFGLFDFREMALLTHTLIIITMVIQTGITAVMIRRNHNREIKTALAVQLLAIGFSIAVATIEAVFYYIEPDRIDDGNFVRYGLIVYIVILSLNALKNLNRQIQDSQMSKVYERMAYTDALTEVLNRAAFERDSVSYRKPGAFCTIISIDLNNLKHINDTLGHSYGDMYITFCTQILREHFSRIASLYRVGGDEFCLLSASTDLEDIQIRMDDVLEDERQIRVRLGVENIGIAYGITSYDSDSGESLEDALRRADRQMYENKSLSKSKGTV